MRLALAPTDAAYIVAYIVLTALSFRDREKERERERERVVLLQGFARELDKSCSEKISFKTVIFARTDSLYPSK